MPDIMIPSTERRKDTAMAITNIEDAQHEVWAMEQDAIADNPDIEIDHADLVIACTFNLESDDLARELCRVELGWIPAALEPRLGKKDWVQ
jgi:hypothetical protein